MKKTLIYTACVAALFSPSVLSQSTLNGCLGTATEERETKIYFANGILVPIDDDEDATVAFLRHQYKRTLESAEQGQIFTFLSAYNPTSGLYADVIEVVNQKLAEAGIANQGLSALQLLQLLRAAALNLGDALAKNAESVYTAEEILRYLALTIGVNENIIPSITPRFLENIVIAIIAAQAREIANIRSVEGRHSNFYTSDLQAGKRVFVIAHSQGNLFANVSLTSAATSLPGAADSLAMIGVATPAAGQFRSSFYRTANDDIVILALSRIATVLPANIDNDPGIPDDFRSVWGHFFVQDYMKNSLPSRRDIDAELTRLASTVPFPTLEAGEGAIRATLTWDAQPDVDLHAFEPSGSHVYYASRRGSSGFLDVDDVSSFGPENYFVACNKIELGTYRIGVNYYRGSAPSTATVSLFLGDGRIPSPKTLTLPIARGVGGDDSPQILFTIGVTQENGTVRYTVQ